MFLATVEDLYSRRMLGFAQSDDHPTAELAAAAINMAVAARGGDVTGVIFHTDKGSQYSPSLGVERSPELLRQLTLDPTRDYQPQSRT